MVLHDESARAVNVDCTSLRRLAATGLAATALRAKPAADVADRRCQSHWRYYSRSPRSLRLHGHAMCSAPGRWLSTWRHPNSAKQRRAFEHFTFW